MAKQRVDQMLVDRGLVESRSRAQAMIMAGLVFSGLDRWHAYEMSWLDAAGKPRVAVGRFDIPADSPNMVTLDGLPP